MPDTNRHFGKSLAVLVALPLLLLTGGCPFLNGDKETAAPGELVQSAKGRIAAPDVPEADLTELVAGNNAFAFDLYQQLRDADGNIFYSPYSISVALAMTYGGARNDTAQQMADTLHYTLPPDRLHPAFNGLDQTLASRREAVDAEGGRFRLNIVNQLFGLIGYEFVQDYLDLIAENYGAGLRLLDFLNAAEESRVVINDWVADQTEQRIEDLIPPGMISAATRLVLVNAIYFDAGWSDKFSEERTRDGSFYLLDGGEASARLMRQTTSYGYAAGDGYQAVELPYEGGKLAMVILLPDSGRFAEFEGTMDQLRAETVIADLQYREVDLTMPRFTFKWSRGLANVLSAMGMPIAFSGAADFSGISVEGLAISEVIHKAFVAVDEEGTEAAAATAVVVVGTAAPETPVEVVVDRPFIFLIRDLETGTILFLGRVVDPTAA